MNREETEVYVLAAKRHLRARVLELDRRKVGAALALLAVAAGIALASSTVPDVVGFAIAVGTLGAFAALAWCQHDRCPSCEAGVDVLADRFCSQCGASLEAVPVRPAELAYGIEDADQEDGGGHGKVAP